MMKKIILIAFALVMSFSFVNAQDILPSQVPSVIINKMRHDFPQAKSVEWEMKGENYEVEFEIGIYRKDHEILYSPTSEVLYHKQEISANELPSVIVEKVNAEYPKYRISDVKKIKKGNSVYYDFEVKSGKIEWELKMDEAGNLISKKQD